MIEGAASSAGGFRFLYPLEMPIRDKIATIAREIYGAEGVEYTRPAERDVEWLEELGLGGLPVCVAKTQYSLSDDPGLLGRPRGFHITVSQVRPSAGAGFLVVAHRGHHDDAGSAEEAGGGGDEGGSGRHRPRPLLASGVDNDPLGSSCSSRRGFTLESSSRALHRSHLNALSNSG